MENKNILLIDIILIILMNVIYGTANTIGGMGMKYFSPFFLYFLRFFICGSISIWFNKFPKEDIKNILFLSIFISLGFLGQSLSVKYLDSSTTSILIRLDVLFSIILNFLFFKEKITINTILSMIFCIFGVLVVKNGINITNIKYLYIVIISAFFRAMVDIMSKRITTNSSTKQVTAWSSLFVGIELFIVALFAEKTFILKPIDSKAIFTVIYFSIFPTYIAYYIMYFLLRKYSISKIVPYNFSRILISLIAGFVLLNEPITQQKLLGGILIIIGIYLSQMKKKEV